MADAENESFAHRIWSVAASIPAKPDYILADRQFMVSLEAEIAVSEALAHFDCNWALYADAGKRYAWRKKKRLENSTRKKARRGAILRWQLAKKEIS